MSQILKSSIIVMFSAAAGMALNFISNMLMAAKFGAGADMDAFFAATTIPLFIVGIFSNAVNFTLIPVFAEYSQKDPIENNTIVSSLINLNLIVTIILYGWGSWEAVELIRITTPGFATEKIIQSAQMMQVILPIVIFTVISEILNCIYYSKQRFILPSMVKILTPTITIMYIVMFHSSLSVKSLAFAMLAAAFVQMVFLFIGIVQSQDFKYLPVLAIGHPGVSRILKLIMPLILGMMVYRMIPIFDRYFLSHMPEGSISHIGYAAQLLNFIYSLIASSITLSLFPVMSKYIAEKDLHNFKIIVLKGLKMLFFLSLPCIFIFGLYSKPFIQILWQRGHFLPADTAAVYQAFIIYVWALPAVTMGALIAQCFYVLQDIKTLVIVGVIETVLYVGLCYYFLPQFQYLAIPIAYGIYAYFPFLTLSFILYSKFGKDKERSLMMTITKNLFAVLVALISLKFLYPIASNVWMQAAAVMVNFILYIAISRFVFKTEEVVFVCDLAFQRIMKQFRG